MSVSTDAILYYGFEAGDEDSIPPKLEATLTDEHYDPELGDWVGDQVRDEPLLDWDSHCCGEHPMYCVYVKRLRYCASRGYPEDIPISLGTPNGDEIAALSKVRKEMGLEDSKIRWRLVSYASSLH